MVKIEIIEAELECKMDQPFGVSTATGQDKRIPSLSSRSSLQQTKHEFSYIPSPPDHNGYPCDNFDIHFNNSSHGMHDTQGLDETSRAWQECWGDDCSSQYPIHRVPTSVEVEDSVGKRKRVIDGDAPQTGQTKKRRVVNQILENLDSMKQAIIERNSTRSRNSIASTYAEALAKLVSTPELKPASHIFNFACELIENEYKRIAILNLPTDAIASYVRYFYDKDTKNEAEKQPQDK